MTRADTPPPATPATRAVIGAVRRHLGRARRVACLEVAAWGVVAGAAGLAGCALLPSPPGPSFAAALPLIAVVAAALLAASRTARDLECARYADRSLGGESAFVTDLGLTPAERQLAAAPLLAQWIATRAPVCLATLARRPPPRPAPLPLAAAAGATLIAALVLGLARPATASGEDPAVVAAEAAGTRPEAPTPGAPRQPHGAAPTAPSVTPAANATATATGAARARRADAGVDDARPIAAAASAQATRAEGGAGAGGESGLGAGDAAGLDHAGAELGRAIHLEAALRGLRPGGAARGGSDGGGLFAATGERASPAVATLSTPAAAIAPAATGAAADGPLANELVRRYLAAPQPPR